jgi:hypothetical protein
LAPFLLKNQANRAGFPLPSCGWPFKLSATIPQPRNRDTITTNLHRESLPYLCFAPLPVEDRRRYSIANHGHGMTDNALSLGSRLDRQSAPPLAPPVGLRGFPQRQQCAKVGNQIVLAVVRLSSV